MDIALKVVLLNGLAIVGMLWYYICLLVIGFQTSKDQSTTGFRQFMSLSITTISVALATFVGMLLGVQVISDEIKEGAPHVATAAAANPPAVKTLNAAVKTATGGTLYIQWVASCLYVVSIVLALFCWWYRGDAKSDPAIVNLAKSLLGLVAGALSILLKLS
jgi:hypothetical protein